MEVIPAIDIIDGKCVRLSEGDYNRMKVYAEDPLEVAQEFERWGVKRLHLVDLDGAKAKRVINLPVLQRIADNTNLVIDFGGGVKSTEDLSRVFEAGAKQVTGGSIAVNQPALFESWLNEFGSERIILGADVKNGMVAINGWQQHSDWELNKFIQYYAQKGVTYVICTDVSKDGMLRGPALDLYGQLIADFPKLSVVASGGVSCYDDLVSLKEVGVAGAIVGKAIYERKITLAQLSEFSNAD
jgi:phosphoribosylformimino-5-aminoimidazole carboxamide ribotide isomerase